MPSIDSTEELFLYENQSYKLVGGQGFLLDPQCELVRALFAKPADLNRMSAQAHGLLPGQNVSLFCIVKSSRDEMVGFLFDWKGKKKMLLAYGVTPFADSYLSKHWDDLEPGADFGFLITGPGRTSIWRIVRVEPDHINRAKLTVKAALPATGLPRLDFSQVTDNELRARIQSDGAKLQEHLANNHADEVVTASKNILEGVLTNVLESTGRPKGGNLAEKLARLEKLVESDPTSTPISPLALHLAQKIRLMHQRTHPERAASLAWRVRPEFLFTCAEDLIEILSTLGYVQDAL
jgi:hypothetical protein